MRETLPAKIFIKGIDKICFLCYHSINIRIVKRESKAFTEKSQKHSIVQGIVERKMKVPANAFALLYFCVCYKIIEIPDGLL